MSVIPLFLALILAVPAVQAPERFEISTADIAQGRKISDYDQGGSLDCRGVTTEDPKVAYARLSSKLEQARKFILEHFQERQKAYIRLTMNSVDALATSHIFIEPDSTDKSGGWRIVWRIARAGRPRRVDDLPIIKSL